jgi:hypothetical protein
VPGGAAEAAVLRVRAALAQRDFAAARGQAEAAVAAFPGAVGPRLALARVLLQEGADAAAAERALRDVLALAPDHAEAQHNLAVLLSQQGRPPGA